MTRIQKNDLCKDCGDATVCATGSKDKKGQPYFHSCCKGCFLDREWARRGKLSFRNRAELIPEDELVTRREAKRASARARTKERYKRNREIITAAKDKPCTDCGVKYPYYVMDLDHVRGKKHKNLGQMMQASEKRVLDEIAKCDVVCSNCHRIRSYKNKVYSKPKKGHC